MVGRPGVWRAGLWALALTACGPKGLKEPPPVAARPVEVRFRPGEAPSPEERSMVAALPKSQWDAGLDRAAEELVARVGDRAAELDPAVTSAVLAQVGFPAQARFLRILNGGAFPEDLLDEALAISGGDPLDVGLARRCWGDGLCLWLLAFSVHRAEIDPLPREVSLDATIAVRVDPIRPGELRLFVAPPEGGVEEMSMSAGSARWIDRFHTPGEYRIEVVGDQRGVGSVLALFSVWVEGAPPSLPPVATRPRPRPDPAAAEALLYQRLNALRRDRGLPEVERFEVFESPAREHSALMAAEGLVRHRLPGRPGGVPEAAGKIALPFARFHEDVAAGYSAEDAFQLVVDSPGHLKNLLCEPCTHASIGVALEPVLDRAPRLFVTWELLEFPEGEPLRILH